MPIQTLRFAADVGLGGDVPLHVRLIDAEVLQVLDDAVSDHDPHRRCRKAPVETAEAELVVFGLRGDPEDLSRSLRHAEQQHRRAAQRSGDQDQCLQHARPDDGFRPAEERIDHDDHSQDDRGRREDLRLGRFVGPEQRRHGERQQIQDHAQPRDLREQEADHGVRPRPGAEAMLQVVCRPRLRPCCGRTGTNQRTAIYAAGGITNANRAAFQFVGPYALPGFARKLMLLTYEPKIDRPTAQPGRLRPAAMNWSLVLVFRKKPMPIASTMTL